MRVTATYISRLSPSWFGLSASAATSISRTILSESGRLFAERLFAAVRPRRVLLLQYSDTQGKAIAELVDRMSIPSQVITTTEGITPLLQDTRGEIVIDCSGLSKPFLFVATRDALRRQKRTAIVHTLPEQSYSIKCKSLYRRFCMAFLIVVPLQVGRFGRSCLCSKWMLSASSASLAPVPAL